MKKLLCSAALVAGTMTFASQAHACEVNASYCVDVPEVQYPGGGVEVVTQLRTACFTAGYPGETTNITEDIVLSDGTYTFVAVFVYQINGVNYEQVKTVTGTYRASDKGWRICWQHQAADGVFMAVYVTCDSYTGWVAGNRVEGNGLIIMTPRPDWDWKPRWM